jgi:hypothetical protein
VIRILVAVNDVADRRLGDFPDFCDVGFRGRAVFADRVGGDDAGGRHDEHRLMALISEVVDIVSDLRGGEGRLLALRMDRSGSADGRQRDRQRSKKHALHGLPPWQVAMCDDDKLLDQVFSGFA